MISILSSEVQFLHLGFDEHYGLLMDKAWPLYYYWSCTNFFLLLFKIWRHTVFENHNKVSFNIASEASYVYILSGQKLIKNTQNGPFWRVFEKPEACGQTVLPDRSLLIGQKMVENAKMSKIENATFWVVFKQCEGMIRVFCRLRWRLRCKNGVKLINMIRRPLQVPLITWS